MSLTWAVEAELTTRLLGHLVYKLDNPDEALLKEVWEGCRGKEERDYVDASVKAVADLLREKLVTATRQRIEHERAGR